MDSFAWAIERFGVSACDVPRLHRNARNTCAFVALDKFVVGVKDNSCQ